MFSVPFSACPKDEPVFSRCRFSAYVIYGCLRERMSRGSQHNVQHNCITNNVVAASVSKLSVDAFWQHAHM